MTKTRAALALLTVVVLGALAASWVALSRGVDLSWSRDWIAARLSESLERPLAIAGPFRLTVGYRTTVEAGEVTIANADWSSGPYFAEAQRVELDLDLWSLLRGPLVIHRLEIQDASVTLERGPEGDGNWPAPTADEDNGGAAVVLEEVDLVRARIRYATPALERPIVAAIDLAQQRYGQTGELELVVRGTLNEAPLQLTAATSTPRAWIAGRNVDVRLDLRLAEGRLAGSARLDDLEHPARPASDLSLTAPDAARIARLIGWPSPGPGPLKASLRLTPRADELGLAVEVEAGELSLALTGNVDSLASVRGLDADLSGSGPNFRVLARPLGWADAPAGPFALEGRARSDGASLSVERGVLALAGMRLELAGELVDLPEPDLRRLRISLKGEELERFRELLGVPGLVDGPFELSATVERGADGIGAAALRVTNRMGRVEAAGRLGKYPDFFGTTARVSVEGPDLGGLVGLAGIEGLPAAPFTGQGELDWTAGGLGLRDVTLRTDAEQLTVTGTVAPDPLGRGTDLEVAIEGEDLARLGPALGLEPLPTVRYAATGRLSRLGAATRLRGIRATLGDATVRLDGTVADPPGLGGTVLQFELAGSELRRWEELADVSLPDGPFEASGELRLDNDAIVLRQVGLEMGGARGRVNADIQLPLGARRGDFSASLTGPDLARLLPELGEAEPVPTPFELELRGNWRGERWFFKQASLRAGGDELNASGTLQLGAEAAATAVPVKLRIQSLERVGTLVGVELPDVALTLEGTLAGTPGELRLDPVLGQLGEDTFTGSLTVKPGDPPRVALALSLSRLDMSPVLPQPTADDDAPAPPPDTRVIPDWPIPTDWLRRLEVDVTLQAGQLVADDVLYGRLELTGGISDNALSVDRLSVIGPFGEAEFRLRLSARGETPRLNATGTLRNVVLVYRVLAKESPDPPRNDVDLRLRGAGGTLRALLGSLDGEFRLVGGPGRVTATAIDNFYSNFFRRITQAVNPFAKSDRFVREVCSILPLTIQDGVISTAPTLVKLTDKLNVIAFGTINLNTERIDLNFKTELRKGLGVSAAELVNPFIKVGGTLADPQILLDKKGVAVSGGAAVLTGGLSIVATTLWNRAFREKDPCGAVLAESNRARQADQERSRLVTEVDEFFKRLE